MLSLHRTMSRVRSSIYRFWAGYTMTTNGLLEEDCDDTVLSTDVVF
jgi:hypothetical protein